LSTFDILKQLLLMMPVNVCLITYVYVYNYTKTILL